MAGVGSNLVAPDGSMLGSCLLFVFVVCVGVGGLVGGWWVGRWSAVRFVTVRAGVFTWLS